MRLLEIPLLLSEIDPGEFEVTVGGSLAGLCLLAALVGSISVLTKWGSRFSQGEPVIPKSERPLLQIPRALLAFGGFIGLMMAVTATLVSVGALGAGPQLTEPIGEAVAVEDGNDALADNVVGDSDDVVLELDDPEAEAELATDLVAALEQTVVCNIAMILVLGIPVLFLKLRRQSVEPDVGEVELNEDTISLKQVVELDDQNPYAVSSTVSSLPSNSVDVAEPVAVPPAEPWLFGREFRVAAEVCLGAWLPTAILRITMVLLLQDEAQHPLLEMIQNGVGVNVMLLIAITAVILAPLMEELLFRVIILGGLLNRKNITASSTAIAVGITSVLFAFAHGFPDNLALLPLAAAIAWTYHQRRSYRTVVMVHFLFNGFNILIAGLGML
jgi:membrane protease YdiL (CAAX protease family)